MTSPTTPRTIPGTDYILEALAAEGLGHLFMVPGGLVDPFLPALARQKNSRRWSRRTRAARSTWPTAMPAPAAASGRRSGSAGPAAATRQPPVAPPRPTARP